MQASALRLLGDKSVSEANSRIFKSLWLTYTEIEIFFFSYNYF